MGNISTHTLTWSVTLPVTLALCLGLFQLTRSRGAWHNQNALWLFWRVFQLTRSRGAWLSASSKLPSSINFNSHAHVERDSWLYINILLAKISTHTLTWSVTPFIIVITCSFLYFNSHAHVERDAADSQPLFAVCISTHTLTWSVTFYPACGKISQRISTHTLTWSVTGLVVLIMYSAKISTHTLTWSVTLSAMTLGTFRTFQLTRSRGAWRVAD